MGPTGSDGIRSLSFERPYSFVLHEEHGDEERLGGEPSPRFLDCIFVLPRSLIILSQTSTSSFLSAHGNPFQDSISSSSVYCLLGYIRSIKIRVRNLTTNLNPPGVGRATVRGRLPAAPVKCP